MCETLNGDYSREGPAPQAAPEASRLLSRISTSEILYLIRVFYICF